MTIFAVDMPSNCSTPHSKFERNRSARSRDMRLQKLAQFLRFFFFFFFLSHTYKNCYKTRTPYPIALKFGTQKGDIEAHLSTNFGWNTINRKRVMSDYSRKITPICCHAYRVNRVWEEAENRWVNRLTIEPQTFCSLKEIELKNRKIQQKNQQYVTITQLLQRLANKKNDCLPRLPDKPLGVML